MRAGELRARDGVFTAPNGATASFGSMAEKASVDRLVVVEPKLKSRAQLRLTGSDHKRVDARAIVTGAKQFAMDLDVADALPTMMARSPTISAGPISVANRSEVQAMPGVTDVAIIPAHELIPGGVAVRAKTFGQCIDAVRALQVTWGKSRVEGKSRRRCLPTSSGPRSR